MGDFLSRKMLIAEGFGADFSPVGSKHVVGQIGVVAASSPRHTDVAASLPRHGGVKPPLRPIGSATSQMETATMAASGKV